MSRPKDKPSIYKISVPGVARSFDRRLILLVNMVPLAMALMQISSVNVALPSISETLGAHSSDLQWVLSGYALAFGISLVPSGRLGDAIGRSTIFTVGLGIFAVASLACGLSPNPLLLNVARVFQGIGAGMQGPQTIGMIQQYFRGQGRARAYSVNGMVVAASVAVGPILTGVLIVNLGPDLGWRLPFIINFPLGLLGCILALRWFPFFEERQRRNSGKVEHAHLDLDPVGATLLTGAIVCVMLPFILTEQPPSRFWLLVGVVVFGAAWFAWETNYGKRGNEPMVDLSLFQLRSFTHQTVISGLDFLGVTSIFVIVAMFLQQGLGWDALHSALIGIPNAALSCLGAMWTGQYILRFKEKLVVITLLIIFVGISASVLVIWLILSHGISPWWLMLTFGVYGMGQGMFTTANQTLAMIEVPIPMAGTAGGVKSMTERVTTAVGNAVMTGILFATLPYIDWHLSVIITYGAISFVLLVALLLAILNMIRSNTHRNAGLHP